MTNQNNAAQAATQELKPCPFCGAEAFATYKTGDDDLRRHSVHCKALDCGAQVRDRHFSEADATAAWNKRTTVQPALTDDEILQVFADAVGNQEDEARFIDVDREQAIRIARTLLSKLRAPVASAEVMDALNWVDDFIARCNRDDRGSCESVNVLRRALASAPVAQTEVAAALDWLDDFVARCNGDDRGSCESVNVLRRALAGAPVAAEAVAALIRERRYLGKGVNGKHFYSDFSEWLPATVSHAKAVTSPGRNALETWEVRWLVDAAPQVSEAVREVAGVTLDGCLETLFRVGEHLGINYAESRKQPGAPSGVYIKAIEDRVSQARDTALEEAAKLMERTSRGTGATLIRVSLSAQPDAEPLSNPKQFALTGTENIRAGAPYDNPAFEALCREHGIWGTAQSALCAVFWRQAGQQRADATDWSAIAAEAQVERDAARAERDALIVESQQHAAGDERAAFEAAYQADYDDPGAACEREHFGKGYRAGLAAQSGAIRNPLIADSKQHNDGADCE